MSEKKVDVFCIGHATFDMVFSVPYHPQSDEKLFASKVVTGGGGPAANAAVAVSRSGLRAAFSGYLGNDQFGEKHYLELKQEGVGLDFILRGSTPTPLSVVLVKPSGNRSLVNYSENAIHISPNQFEYEKLRAKVILFDGHQPLVSNHLASWARDKETKTILDAGSVHTGTLDLINLVDYLICAEKFSVQYTGFADEKKAIEKLSECAHTVIITLGKRGLIWKTPEDVGYIPSHDIDVVDTTGAGDTFHGTFASCVASGIPLKESLHYANASAALSCTKLGARAGIPYSNDVKNFLSRI